jgi:hypothetical protein
MIFSPQVRCLVPLPQTSTDITQSSLHLALWCTKNETTDTLPRNSDILVPAQNMDFTVCQNDPRPRTVLNSKFCPSVVSCQTTYGSGQMLAMQRGFNILD